MDIKFELGTVIATPAAISVATLGNLSLKKLLARHQSGDWGNLTIGEIDENEVALEKGGRIFSCYEVRCGKFVIVTDADRLSTVIKLPD